MKMRALTNCSILVDHENKSRGGNPSEMLRLSTGNNNYASQGVNWLIPAPSSSSFVIPACNSGYDTEANPCSGFFHVMLTLKLAFVSVATNILRIPSEPKLNPMPNSMVTSSGFMALSIRFPTMPATIGLIAKSADSMVSVALITSPGAADARTLPD